ncbi:hypothetical protein ACVILJ_006750 [Bradyrhizobium diazoefficiens]
MLQIRIYDAQKNAREEIYRGSGYSTKLCTRWGGKLRRADRSNLRKSPNCRG